VIVGGYAGSGKTEFSRRLAQLTGWALVDKDSITQAVVRAALRSAGESPDDRESHFYRSTLRPAEYQAVWDTTYENVESGNSVIMVAPFTSELRDSAWCRRAGVAFGDLGAIVHAVWVRCDPASMRARILRRAEPRDTGKLARWDQYLAGLDLAYTPAMPHTIIENSLSSEPLRQQAERLAASLEVESPR
jgi:predicted kinase